MDTSDNVLVVAEFLVNVNDEVDEGTEAAEDDGEQVMRSLEGISLREHDYTLAIEAEEVG